MIVSLSKAAAGLFGAAALVLASAIPALAHVTVDSPAEAVQGSFPTVTFRVPNEHATAANVSVKIEMPTSPAVPFVLVKTNAGWTHKIEHSAPGEPGQNVRSVTWSTTRTEAKLKPGEFTEFELVLAPIPAADRLYFPTSQFYDNGEVVRWNEIPSPGNPNPPHPAPSLKVTAPAQAGTAAQPANLTLGGDRVEQVASRKDESTGTTLAVLTGLVLLIGASGVLFVRRRLTARDQS